MRQEGNADPTPGKPLSYTKGTHAIEQGMWSDDDQIRVGKLKELEGATFELENKKMAIQNQLKDKGDAIQAEKERQAQLQKILDDMEAKKVLKRKSSQIESNFNVKKEQENRALILQKQDKDTQIQEESHYEEEEAVDEELQQGEVPKDVRVLKMNYDTLLKKFNQKELDLKDAEAEHNDDKFDLIDQIRDQKKEVIFYQRMIAFLTSPEDIEKLRLKSKWSDADNSFMIPGFLLNNKKMTFPKIPKHQSTFFFVTKKSFGGMATDQRRALYWI